MMVLGETFQNNEVRNPSAVSKNEIINGLRYSMYQRITEKFARPQSFIDHFLKVQIWGEKSWQYDSWDLRCKEKAR